MKNLEKYLATKSSPYIIAEIGVNHEGSMDLAKKLIRLAAQGGASAAKFQSYKANKIASKNSPSYWDTNKEETKSQYELFKKYDNFGEKEYIELASYCEKLNIDFLSTPFDINAVDFLDPLVPFFKIASADINNIPFLRAVAKKLKPVILSTGASTLSEIDEAIRILNENGCKDISLLHCILNYPTLNKNANLNMISSLIKNYPNLIIGYSDHTLPDQNMTSLVSSYLLGAKIIEKHFTYDKKLKGNDHYHAMDIDDLTLFVSLIKNINDLLGTENFKKPIDTEMLSRRNARRSIVLTKAKKEGELLTEIDLTCKRPGTGISPIHWDDVLGKRVRKNKNPDDILNWEDLS